ncbi:MAG: hypothetical protein WCY93_10570 [Anaerolineaceae bacterium]|nr:hypothetical protein [Brevefilum sp.]
MSEGLHPVQSAYKNADDLVRVGLDTGLACDVQPYVLQNLGKHGSTPAIGYETDKSNLKRIMILTSRLGIMMLKLVELRSMTGFTKNLVLKEEKEHD